MFDLSGILKKYQESKKTVKIRREAEDIYSPVPPPGEDKVNISGIMTVKSGAESEPGAKRVYDTVLTEIKGIYFPDKGAAAKRGDHLGAASMICGYLETDSSGLLKLVFSDYREADDFLCRHAVNVGILVLLLAKHINCNPEMCIDICLAGLLHDAGLGPFAGIINKRGVLTKSEYAQVREHPGAGVDILNHSGLRLNPKIIDAVYQEHERLDGSGYPRGLKQEAIGEFARIIGVVDVYESLSHWRPYRQAYSFSEAVKILLEKKEYFDRRVAKALIESIGIFPVGSLVRLNTRELAVVTGINSKMPLRPAVTILFDAYGKELTEPKQVDLSGSTVIYVEDCLKAGGTTPGRGAGG